MSRASSEQADPKSLENHHQQPKVETHARTILLGKTTICGALMNDPALHIYFSTALSRKKSDLFKLFIREGQNEHFSP